LSVLSVKDISKSFGAAEVLRGSSFNLEEGERAGLVGANGCGKTTLLEIISGRMKPDSGLVSASRGISIGYLEQSAPAEQGESILGVMLAARPDVQRLKAALTECADRVAVMAESGVAEYESAMDEYGALLEEFESSGGYSYENEATGALIGLGFTSDEFGRAVSTLSGGERTRLMLARMLVAGHGLLLLDEPTNHLDINAIAWLEGFLERFRGAALIVSHDRYFLDRVATRVLEMERGVVESYPGNYSRYRAEKHKRDEARRKEYSLALARYEKEKEYINRMRAGVNARQAKGREKRLARFDMPDTPDAPKRSIRLEIESFGRTSDTVALAESVNVSYGGEPVLKDVSFTIRRGERVGIVGPNGSGKSTLLKVMLGELQPGSGSAGLGANVVPGYYAQGMEGLSETSTVLDELWSASPMSTEQEVRDLLGAFLFTGDAQSKKVGRLSGGEKGRLAIAKIVIRGANLLVLDEPTNHLDIPSREALEDAVACFAGTVISVSHDRYFLDEFAGRIFELHAGRLTQYLGNYSDYARKKAEAPREAEPEPSEGRLAWQQQKNLKADARRQEREARRRMDAVAGIESEIEHTELAILDLEARLADPDVCTDYSRLSGLTAEYDKAKARRDALYEQLEKELA
jgi:ATP-binding cassette, subfamily F, member 3